jgi:hypothetical protein
MAEIKQKSPRLALDVLIVAAGVGLQLLSTHFGVKAGQGFARGMGTVLGGISIIYFGVLFLLSYFFPDTSYILNFLRFVCEECSRGARGRHMAFFYFALALGFGGWLLLFGLGVF